MLTLDTRVVVREGGHELETSWDVVREQLFHQREAFIAWRIEAALLDGRPYTHDGWSVRLAGEA